MVQIVQIVLSVLCCYLPHCTLLCYIVHYSIYPSLTMKQKSKLDKTQYTGGNFFPGWIHFYKKNYFKQWTRLGIYWNKAFDQMCIILLYVQKNFFNFPKKKLKLAKILFSHVTKIYNLLNDKTRKFPIQDFKQDLCYERKPYNLKHFSYGLKCSNMHLTRIRVERSYIKYRP